MRTMFAASAFLALLTAALPAPVEVYETMTPYGYATITVRGDAAVVTIGTAKFGPVPLSQLCGIPGQEQATVQGGMCERLVYGGTSPHGGPVIVFQKKITGSGITLNAAINDYKKNVEKAGANAVPCGPSQG